MLCPGANRDHLGHTRDKGSEVVPTQISKLLQGGRAEAVRGELSPTPGESGMVLWGLSVHSKTTFLILSRHSKTVLVIWGTVGRVVPVSRSSALFFGSHFLLGQAQCGSCPEENPSVVMLQERSHVRALHWKGSSALV